MNLTSNDSNSRPLIIWILAAFVVLALSLAGFSIYSAATKGLDPTAAAQPETEASMVKETIGASSIYQDPAAVNKQLTNQIELYIHDQDYDLSDLSIYIESDDESVTYKLNIDQTRAAASTYKLALAMLYYDEIADGEMKPESTVSFDAQSLRDEGANPILTTYGVGYAVPVEEAVSSMLIHSDNTAAAILYDNLGGWEEFMTMRTKYSKYPDIPEDPLDNVCTAAQLMDEVRLLYQNQKKYAPIIADLDEATEDSYLNEVVANDTMIQKYGQVGGATNSVGFSKAGNPYRIVVLSNSANNAVDPGMINKIAYEVLNQTGQANEKFWETIEIESIESVTPALEPAAQQTAPADPPAQSAPAPSYTPSYTPAYPSVNVTPPAISNPEPVEPSQPVQENPALDLPAPDLEDPGTNLLPDPVPDAPAPDLGNDVPAPAVELESEPSH